MLFYLEDLLDSSTRVLLIFVVLSYHGDTDVFLAFDNATPEGGVAAIIVIRGEAVVAYGLSVVSRGNVMVRWDYYHGSIVTIFRSALVLFARIFVLGGIGGKT